MKVLRIIRNYFCYCGLEKKEYNSIKKSAYISNFEVWRVLHLLMDASFLVLFILSLINDFMGINKWFYLGALIYSVLATIPFFVFKRKDSIISQFLIYLSISVLLLFGCFLSSNKVEYPAITFIAFLLLTPVFMIDKPYFMSLELIVASTIYIIWMSFIKAPDVFRIDVVNVVAYTLIGIMMHIIVNSIRIKEFVLIKKINIQKDFDELTGIKNKAALTREINEFVESSDNNKGLFFVIDIDYFKQINDTFGHDVGDRILDELGHYFKGKFPDKNEVVGRFGGDEFILFIKDNDNVSFAKELAMELSKEVGEKIKLPEEGNTLSLSIGIAIYQGEEKHYSELFKKADIALYKTKANRKNVFTINQ